MYQKNHRVQKHHIIVSKNGVLLLNVAPKADGTIPDDQRCGNDSWQVAGFARIQTPAHQGILANSATFPVAKKFCRTDDQRRQLLAIGKWLEVNGEALKLSVNGKKQLVIDASAINSAHAPCRFAYSFRLSGFDLDIQPDAVRKAPKTKMVHD